MESRTSRPPTNAAGGVKRPSCFTESTSSKKGLIPRELRGKDLVCTCKLTDLCHADVLLDLANRD